MIYSQIHLPWKLILDFSLFDYQVGVSMQSICFVGPQVYWAYALANNFETNLLREDWFMPQQCKQGQVKIYASQLVIFIEGQMYKNMFTRKKIMVLIVCQTLYK